jgi:fibronectin type 3 domain-containing protein
MMRPLTIQISGAKQTLLRWMTGLMALIALPALADFSIPLAWNPSADSTVAGYKIYFGGASHAYTNSIDVGNVTNAVITGLAENATYYFAATTYDASGVESDFSNEAAYVATNSTVSTAPAYQSPTLDPLSNLNINENSGAQSIALNGISLGSGTSLNVTAVSSNPSLIANPTVSYTSPATAGTLTFAPAANASGSAVVTVTVDNGMPQSNLVTCSFTITVAAVNQAPTLDPIANLSLAYNAGAQIISLTGISAGAAGENQNLKITAVSSNVKVAGSLKISYVSPNTTGSLSLKSAANASGVATITVTVNDGGASNNITTRSFTVTVAPKATSSLRPVLWGSLTNRYTLPGKMITFSTKATGAAPLKYQWKHDGTNVPGATSATLTLKNVTTKQAGLYNVTVSNSAGSTNSPAAALVVYTTTAATLESAGVVNGQFAFNVIGVPGYQYVVQASSDLANWTAVETNTAPFTFVDGSATENSKRFYRTVSVP